MKIALDVMGGDNAPSSNIDGAFEYIDKSGDNAADIILVGDETVIQGYLQNYQGPHEKITIHQAPDIVEMDDRPAKIHRTKPNSSLVQSVKLVKDQQADAVVCAGNTGALLSSSLFLIGKLTGIKRPALSAHIPGYKGDFVLCDAGANTDVKPQNLVQFGIMASAYLEYFEGKTNPKVGLLNIGTEDTKGNELTQTAYPLMQKYVQNFIGNIEARYILNGDVDVVVCDGFVGNTVLKFIEGVMLHMISWFKDSIKSQPNGSELLTRMGPTFLEMVKNLDYEEYGATPFLGVNGIVLKCHGSSSKRAMSNSISSAQKVYEKRLIPNITERISTLILDE